MTPHRSSRLFPEYAAAAVPGDVVTERMLEDGTGEDLRRWFKGTTETELRGWLGQKGDRLSARSHSFWVWVLEAEELTRSGVNELWPLAGESAL